MSEPSERQPAAKKPNYAFQWGTRAVLLAVLVVAVLLYFMESRVQSDFEDSFHAVGNGVDTANLYKKDVDALLKGSPKREKISDGEERFVWRSPITFLFGDHAFRLHYESDGFVRRIDPERTAEGQ